jgi:hypothetical protein
MPRVDTVYGPRHISMEEYERREQQRQVDEAEAWDDRPRPPTSKDRSDFGVMMREIREAYAKQPVSKTDSAKFDALVGEAGLFEPNRWPLRHVTNALVRVSPHAQLMNRKYFGSRFK